MQYETLASADVVTKTIENLTKRGMEAMAVSTRTEALEKIKELIPAGASVMNGTSRTLEEIGYIDYVKTGQHGWKNLKEKILQEQDPARQAQLRKQAVLSDYYLGSVHAVTESGQLVIASNSGSQLPHIVYTSPHLILVVGTHKITTDLDAGLARVHEYVYPLEDQRMKDTGGSGSAVSKVLIIEREPDFAGRKVLLIFVAEKLGF